jgi:asparagine synthase (glutamine-hydrolysing)
MNAVIRHRGPDDHGVYTDGAFGVGNVRLAIRDVAHGRQPMVDASAGVAVVFNGEVWNDRELRTLLESRGHRFTTACDTEVILHGYKEWGTDLFARLHADFALAIVDSSRRLAVVARDRLGIKPLYYTTTGPGFAASSEIKALLAVCPRGHLNHRPLDLRNHAALYADPAGTEVEGVAAVLPGEFIECSWEDGHAVTRRRQYHRQDYRLHGDSLDVAVGRVAELLEDAVRRQVVSDRPLAVALSGGVDSSVIAALASRHVDLMCYSIGAQGATETANARAVVEHLRRQGHRITGFREVRVDEPAVRRHLDAALWHLESSYPIQADMAVVTHLLAAAVARDGYPVLLSGEGADELFLGYHSYFRRKQREGRLTEAMVEQLENLHRYNNARLDKSCMAHGVEARVPFQHAPLVDYAVGIDPALKMGNPTPGDGRPDMQKFVLRRAAEQLRGVNGGPLLPPEVVWQRKEYYAQGMGLPGLIGRALGLSPTAAETDAACLRQEVYAKRLARQLFGDDTTRVPTLEAA